MKLTKQSTPLYIPLILIVFLSTTSCVIQQPADQYTDTFPTSTAAFTPLSFHAKVTRVLDGDTIEVLTEENLTLRIRLQGIDAPEKTQIFGDTAQQQLTTLILNKEVNIESNKKDNHGRLIGKVTRDDNDICLMMINTGHAWWFKRYAETQSPNDRLSYSRAEDQSRQQRIGLWANPNPTPPWTYRQQTRKRTSHSTSRYPSNISNEQQWQQTKG